jgi:septum formation inhibitor MinC
MRLRNIAMFASLFQNTKRKSPTRSARLAVETLEGRAMMSTLAGLAGPAVAAVWPPPPPAQAQVMEMQLGGGTVDSNDNVILLGGIRPGSDVAGGAYDDVAVAGTRRSGDELPELCGGKPGGVDMDTVLLGGGYRPGSDV